MTYVHRSTDAAPPAERFAFWHDAVCRSVLSVSVAADGAPERFAGRIAARRVGRASVAAFRSTAHVIERGRRQAERLDDPGTLVSLQLAGIAWMEQDGRRFRLAPGEFGVLDGGRPFTVRFPQPVERIVAVLPRSLLGDRAPALLRRGATKLVLRPALAGLLRQTLRALPSSDPAIDDDAGRRLCENACNLLGMASIDDGEVEGRADTSAGPRLVRRREAIAALIDRHAADATLDPARVAAALGVSVRSVHDALAGTGLSFGARLLESRLQRCHAALLDTGECRGIAALALDVGFCDVSHFNHAFRRRFGATPSDVRAAAREASAATTGNDADGNGAGVSDRARPPSRPAPRGAS